MSTNVVPLKTGGQIQGIVPQTIEEIFRLATAVCKGGFAPRGDTPEAVTAKIMKGMEIGLPPMFSVQNIAMINGRPSVWGDAIPALLWGRGFKIKEWSDDTAAYCTITRPDGEQITRDFSEAKALKAGLWGKAGPWSQYPDRMLQMRARGFAARDGASDVLGGLWIAEEAQDIELSKSEYRVETVAPPEIPDIPDIPMDASPQEPDTSDEAVISEWIGRLEGTTPFEAHEIEQEFKKMKAHLPREVQKEIKAAIEAAKDGPDGP